MFTPCSEEVNTDFNNDSTGPISIVDSIMEFHSSNNPSIDFESRYTLGLLGASKSIKCFKVDSKYISLSPLKTLLADSQLEIRFPPKTFRSSNTL